MKVEDMTTENIGSFLVNAEDNLLKAIDEQRLGTAGQLLIELFGYNFELTSRTKRLEKYVFYFERKSDGHEISLYAAWETNPEIIIKDYELRRREI